MSVIKRAVRHSLLRRLSPQAMLIAAALLAPPAFPLTLVEQGEPRAAVVIGQEAAPCVPVAAEELRRHIEAMSGAELPLVEAAEGDTVTSLAQGRNLILIGSSSLTRELGVDTEALPSDGFVIRSLPGCLVVCGNDADRFSMNYDWVPASAGTLYGAYRVLEGVGVRWFYPGELGTVIPQQETVEIPELNVRDAPYFPYRFGGYGRDLMTWYRRVGFGGDRDPWSTRHTFNQTVDFWGKYGADRPEYFRVGTGGKPAQSIALGHPEVIDPIVSEALAFFRSDRPPGKKRFLVIPADGAGHCQCDRCVQRLDLQRGPRGHLSNIVAEAAVQVAAAVRARHPQGRVVYCAYNNYYLPPTTVPSFPPNLDLLIAQPRSGFLSESHRADAEQVLRNWMKLRPPAIYFCRYYGSMQTQMPSFMPGIIARDLKALKAINEESHVPIGGEMNFVALAADGPHSWWHHLNSYLTAKLLWNPDEDVDAILDDYCVRFYGPGAGAMREFWDRCAELYLDEEQRELFTVETIDDLESYLGAAKVAVEDSEYAARFAFVDRGFDSVRMLRSKLRSAEQDVSPDTSRGLIMHYSFDGPFDVADPVVQDESREHGGRAAGAIGTDGVRGAALSFTGEASGIRITPLDLAVTDYSVSAWVSPSEPLFEREYQILGPHAYDRHSLKVVSGRLWLWHRTESGSWEGQRLSCAGPLEGFVPGRWYHVAGTYSRIGGMALYIDGQLRALDTTKTEASVHPVANIGAAGFDDFQDCFPGAIDEVRVYGRELSAAEVKQLYRERR